MAVAVSSLVGTLRMRVNRQVAKYHRREMPKVELCGNGIGRIPNGTLSSRSYGIWSGCTLCPDLECSLTIVLQPWVHHKTR